MSNIGSGFKPKSTAARLPPACVACKCQICNCGSHKCPPDSHLHLMTQYEADQLRTGYQRDFPAHAPAHTSPVRRDMNRSSANQHLFGGPDVPFAAETTAGSAFRAPGVAPAKPARPPQATADLISGANKERSFNSESHTQFSPKGIAKRESYAPVGAQHTTGAPFAAHSTNSEDFRHHAGAKPSTPFKPAQTALTASKEDRDFQSEAARKFVQHSDQRRHNFAPPPRSRDASLPFEGVSTTKADFPGWVAPPARSCAPQQQSHLSASGETRDFKSQNAMDFDPKGYQKRESFKPRGGDQVAHSGPFQGVPTSKADYNGAQGDRARSMRPSQGLTDTIGTGMGARDERHFASENRAQFAPKAGGGVRESYAPVGAQHTTGAPFAATSTNTENFRYHPGAKPSTPFIPAQTALTAGREDRDFQSESSNKFVQHGDQRRPNFAPAPRSRDASLPFQGESTTKADFKPWQRPGCPANQLPNNGAKSADGHTLYYNNPNSGQWSPHLPQQGGGQQ